jgi:hypothetical protein
MLHLLHDTLNKARKIKYKEEFRNEVWKRNVTLHVAAKDVTVHLGFGPFPVLSSTGLG